MLLLGMAVDQFGIKAMPEIQSSMWRVRKGGVHWTPKKINLTYAANKFYRSCPKQICFSLYEQFEY